MRFGDDDLLSRDKLYPIDRADRVRAGVPFGMSAVWTGKTRRPKAGEWYLKVGEWHSRAGDEDLKGEIIFAYLAAANLTAQHAIAELSPGGNRGTTLPVAAGDTAEWGL
jgi:hypothetical protein